MWRMSPNSHHTSACKPNDPDEKLPLREVIRRGRPGPPRPSPKIPVRTGK